MGGEVAGRIDEQGVVLGAGRVASPAPSDTATIAAGYLGQITLTQAALTFLLLLLPCATYARWRNGPRETLPLFAILALMYWLNYAVPLFWGERIISDIHSPLGRELPGEAFTLTIAMVRCSAMGTRPSVG